METGTTAHGLSHGPGITLHNYPTGGINVSYIQRTITICVERAHWRTSGPTLTYDHFERYLGWQNPFSDLCICVEIATYVKN